MTPNCHWLKGYRPFTTAVEVFLGDNHCLHANGIGYMSVILPSATNVIIHDIYHIPRMSRNLLSVIVATSTGSSVEFFHDSCVIHFKLPSGHFEMIKLPQHHRLYPLIMKRFDDQAVITLSTHLQINQSSNYTHVALSSWAYQCAHFTSNGKERHVPWLAKNLSPIDLYEGCILGKASHQSFP
ncbi:hypothetical protein L7F22_056783 [Adiantum nelumboides]|nr:hypothetical protein [Adiantum nelumboides]